jgi:hypothetical protein
MPGDRVRHAGTPSPADLPRLLEDGSGYVLLPGLIDPALVEHALRRLNLEIMRCGLSAEQIQEWKNATFWPSLRHEPEIEALLAPLAEVLAPQPGEEWGEPQILLRFPDEASEWPLTPHVDSLPEWAGGRAYRAIVGVALSRSHAIDGCLTVWPGSHREPVDEPEIVEMDPGDAVVMHPLLGHSSMLNRGGHIRYVIYYRLLSATP